MRTPRKMFLSKFGDFENFRLFDSDQRGDPYVKSRKFSKSQNSTKNIFLGVLIVQKHDFDAYKIRKQR